MGQGMFHEEKVVVNNRLLIIDWSHQAKDILANNQISFQSSKLEVKRMAWKDGVTELYGSHEEGTLGCFVIKRV